MLRRANVVVNLYCMHLISDGDRVDRFHASENTSGGIVVGLMRSILHVADKII
jgi:hypothetical protein